MGVCVCACASARMYVCVFVRVLERCEIKDKENLRDRERSKTIRRLLLLPLFPEDNFGDKIIKPATKIR